MKLLEQNKFKMLLLKNCGFGVTMVYRDDEAIDKMAAFYSHQCSYLKETSEKLTRLSLFTVLTQNSKYLIELLIRY